METTLKRKKTGGRQKGSMNRTTNEHRQYLMEVLGIFEQSLKDDIKSLSPFERLKMWLAIQQFLVPKPNAEKPEKRDPDEPQKIEITREIVYRALSEEEIKTGSWKND